MLTIAQIAVSIILIILVLLQERSGGMSGLFGGGGAGSAYQTRRGIEKFVFWATVVAATAFGALAVLNLLL